MRTKNVMIMFLTALMVAVLPLSAAQKMAVITKMRGDVAVKGAKSKKFDKKGKIGLVLEAGDIIKTGSGGYSVVVFLDDKSQIKLHESCTLEINGTRQNDVLSKNVTMGFGKLKAEVEKQMSGEFKIATPTSVASVKGTEFWVISDESSGDQVIGLSGLVELLNQMSGQSVMVGSNQTGFSMPGGEVDVTQTQPESVPEDEEEGEGAELNQLRFEYRNSDGSIREVIIDYR